MIRVNVPCYMPSGRLRRRIANALDQDVEKEMIGVNERLDLRPC